MKHVTKYETVDGKTRKVSEPAKAEKPVPAKSGKTVNGGTANA